MGGFDVVLRLDCNGTFLRAGCHIPETTRVLWSCTTRRLNFSTTLIIKTTQLQLHSASVQLPQAQLPFVFYHTTAFHMRCFELLVPLLGLLPICSQGRRGLGGGTGDLPFSSNVGPLKGTDFSPNVAACEASVPQIVDFYAPWCPHCQHFAPE